MISPLHGLEETDLAMAQLLLEHQGKRLLHHGGIAIPGSVLVRSPDGLALQTLGLRTPVIAKAQVPVGRRGKAGGIILATSDDELQAAVAHLLGLVIRGHLAESVLIEPRMDFLAERYASVSIIEGRLLLMLGKNGGVDVEEAAVGGTQGMAMMPLGSAAEISPIELRPLLRQLGLPPGMDTSYLDLANRLVAVARRSDATMVEINPLVETHDGRLLALDARISVDTAALGRQPGIAAMLAGIAPGPTEQETEELVTIRTNPNGGTVGLIGLGGGLNLTIVDWIAHAGSGVHSLTDIDSAIAAGRAEEAFNSVLDSYDCEKEIEVIFVNIITAGYRLDDIVAALIPVLRTRNSSTCKPVVLHLYGNAMADTPAMLSSVGFSNSASLQEAVRHVITASGY